MQAVMRIVLSFSLVFAFTTSAAAALCLQMEQHGPMSMGDRTVAMEPSGQPGAATAMSMTAGPKGSPSAQACCHQQVNTTEGITAPQPALPAEQVVALAAQVESFPDDSGYRPPGFFDPVLERRDHLTPSLTALSISRT
ncbi:MAG: hypothetical protein ACLGHS_13095 [Actinomycetes bacterium]|uniref:hypothetical protein n=1 Tax=Arthrobacter sp. 35/47 TaxID=269454 RepID=UPI00047DE9B7|nr:hypothetical protein [Arthrobacter sp. 35/47]